jgi:tetratricopeptide (TPR) repeat protein
VRTIRTVHGVCFSIICVLCGVALAQQPVEFESLVASAQQAQARGDFEGAAEYYRKATAVRPEIAELRANLGLMYFQAGKIEQSAEALREAIRLRPGLFVPNLFLGLDYVKLQRFRDALPYLKRAAVFKPSDIQVQLGLGRAYAGLGDTHLAIDSYLKAIQLDSQDGNTWYQLGVSYLEEVESDARTLFARHRDSGYLLALEAETLAQQRAFAQADQLYKKALSSREFPPGTHAGYGFLLLRRQDLAGAERELNAELAVTPGSLLANLGFARLQVEHGETEQCAKELEEIWRSDADFLRANASIFSAGLSETNASELQSVLKVRQTSGGMSQEAIALFAIDNSGAKHADLSNKSALAAKEPVRVSDLTSRSAARLYASGRYRDCTDVLGPRVPALPAKSLELLAVCAYASGHYGDAYNAGTKLAVNASTQAIGLYWETQSAEKLAILAFARAGELDSNSPKLHVLLGDIYRRRRSFPDAEHEYRKALALLPEDPGAVFGLALVLLDEKQVDDALRLAKASLEKNPDDPELNAVMGEILCDRDDFSAAEPYLNKSLKAKPEYVPHVRELLSMVYAKTNRTSQAITELKLALPGDKDGHLHYQIARLYSQIGNRSSAKQALDESNRIRAEGLTGVSMSMREGEDSQSQ